MQQTIETFIWWREILQIYIKCRHLYIRHILPYHCHKEFKNWRNLIIADPLYYHKKMFTLTIFLLAPILDHSNSISPGYWSIVVCRPTFLSFYRGAWYIRLSSWTRKGNVSIRLLFYFILLKNSHFLVYTFYENVQNYLAFRIFFKKKLNFSKIVHTFALTQWHEEQREFCCKLTELESS